MKKIVCFFLNCYYCIIIFAIDLGHIHLEGSSVTENLALAESTQCLK